MTTTRQVLDMIVSSDFDIVPLLDDGRITVEGDATPLRSVFAELQTFPMFFAIIEP